MTLKPSAFIPDVVRDGADSCGKLRNSKELIESWEGSFGGFPGEGSDTEIRWSFLELWRDAREAKGGGL